jgi:hypothetical protein
LSVSFFVSSFIPYHPYIPLLAPLSLSPPTKHLLLRTCQSVT